jgi:hypothetical protein
MRILGERKRTSYEICDVEVNERRENQQRGLHTEGTLCDCGTGGSVAASLRVLLSNSCNQKVGAWSIEPAVNGTSRKK